VVRGFVKEWSFRAPAVQKCSMLATIFDADLGSAAIKPIVIHRYRELVAKLVTLREANF
jgi:hypothetical protein